MLRRIMTCCVSAAMVIGIAIPASAYSGRTTDKTYRTGTQAAKATAAYYLSKTLRAPYHARDLRVTKMGRTPRDTVSSTWRLQTTKRTPMGYPMANVSVKVKKLSPTQWKGYTDGKNNVVFLKSLLRRR